MAGADAYVPQPVRDGELLARIEGWTGGPRGPVRPATAPARWGTSDQLVCGVFRFAVAERRCGSRASR
jgi:DNA-binding response OmpR family regulator